MNYNVTVWTCVTVSGMIHVLLAVFICLFCTCFKFKFRMWKYFKGFEFEMKKWG